MNVNNKTYIRRLAKNILNANKNRRNILLLSIALTSILFTSLFSVALGLGKSMETQTMKTIGTISHGSFKELSDKDISILSNDKDIKEFSIREKVGILDDEKISAELSYIDNNGFEWSLIESVPVDIVEECYIRENTTYLLQSLKKILSEKEYQVICYRYGLFGMEEETQREIAQKLCISRSYVSRIEKTALQKLRELFPQTE